ncbi:MAG: YncE family protein [Actinomycetes bacterium]
MRASAAREPILAFALLGALVIVGVKVASSQHSQEVVAKPTATLAQPSPKPKPTHRVVPASTRPAGPSDSHRLRHVTTIGGAITPKSVDASSAGFVTAQNMIYQHSITVYDDHTYTLHKTISDRVTLSNFGFTKYHQPVRGGPVEAAFTPDGRYEYVSNYSMYGPGFGHPGHDKCSPSSSYDRSFLYRIDLSTLKIDQAIQVGAVPKYLVVTPDDKYVLVSNWCSYSLSVVSVATGKQIRQLYVGSYPRGIAVNKQSTTAYVAVMGTSDLARVSLDNFTVRDVYVGPNPRHVVIDPAGHYLYVTLNAAGKVVKFDLQTDHVVGTVSTGQDPRSMVIAPDGRSLYVVNYTSNTMSKLRTSDMKVLQAVDTPTHPIGITFDPRTGDVWVACYHGAIAVFADR